MPSRNSPRAALLSNIGPRIVGSAALVVQVCCVAAGVGALVKVEPAFAAGFAGMFLRLLGPQITAREVMSRGGS